MKKSKNTLALLAQFPSFRDWIVQNLTVAQLGVVCQTPWGNLWFGEGHPLNDPKFAAGLFRAYKADVKSQLRYGFPSFDMFLLSRGQGATNEETYHRAVVWALVFLTQEYPEVLEEALGAGMEDCDDDPA
jgi:hypothetical protein